jgi:regulation of enolase protein 1 (concanavalin A-like superfamily)
MFPRSSHLFASLIALGTTAAVVLAGDDATPRDLPGWGRVLDPSGDCEVSLDLERNRLKVTVPGTPHVLSAEDPTLPMNAPRVVRRVRGDFTAEVRVLGRLEPGGSRTTYYDPYHGAGLIVWQDPSNYLRLERAVGFIAGRPHPYLNYELREGGRLTMSRGITIEDRPLFLRLRRQGREFSAWSSGDGHRWVQLPGVDATLDERVEVGVVAVNSSARTLSAELEGLSVNDPQGSMARDY